MPAPEGNKFAEGKGGGRPSKVKTISLKQVAKLAELGLSDEEIADFYSISRSTLSAFKKANEEFSDVIKRGKLKADTKVVRSLYERAVGFTTKEVTLELKTVFGGLVVTDSGIKEGMEQKMVPIKQVIKQVAGDVGAQIMWLKNRRHKDWADKKQIEHSGSIHAGKSEAELLEHLERLRKDSE